MSMPNHIPLSNRRAKLLSEMFRKELKGAGLTQKQAAELLGVSKGTVNMVLAGERLPSLPLYERMVEQFPGMIGWLTHS